MKSEFYTHRTVIASSNINYLFVNVISTKNRYRHPTSDWIVETWTDKSTLPSTQFQYLNEILPTTGANASAAATSSSSPIQHHYYVFLKDKLTWDSISSQRFTSDSISNSQMKLANKKLQWHNISSSLRSDALHCIVLSNPIAIVIIS